MKRIIFAGTGDVAVQIMQQIFTQVEIVGVLTREDAAVGRKRELKQSPVALLAAQLDIPVIKTNRPDTSSASQIAQLDADMGVVVSYGALLPADLLNLMDWYNVHFSLLPQLRGAAPVQWGLIQGLEQTGISVFKLDSGMDTGDLFAQRKIAIEPTDTTLSLLPKLAKLSIPVLVDLFNSKQPSLKPQQGTFSLAPKLAREDARIDFSESAQVVCNLIRGCYPEPTAWAEFRGSNLKIISAVASNRPDNPGSLNEAAIGEINILANSVLVTCGANSTLELQRLQPAGKNEMSAIDWSRGLSGELRFD